VNGKQWSRFTHEMSHSVYNLPGKTTRQKLARVPIVSVLKKIKKPNLDPPCVCPKLQVQATFYCLTSLASKLVSFPFFLKGNENKKYLFLIFRKYKMHEIVARKACRYF